MTSPEQPKDAATPWMGVLDLGTLQELLSLDDGAPGLVVEMTQLFREDMPERLRALKEALAAGNGVGASEVAHAMKGASGAIGAPALQALAAEMERACRQGRLEGQEGLLARMEQVYAEAIGALDAFIAAHG